MMRSAHTGPVKALLLMVPHSRTTFDAVAQVTGNAAKVYGPLRVLVLLFSPLSALAFTLLAKHRASRLRLRSAKLPKMPQQRPS